MSAAVLVLIPVLLYFVLIRPQRQRVNAQRTMLTALAPGDEVLTAGGLMGTVVSVEDNEVHVQIAPGTVVRFALTAIVRRVGPPVASPDEPLRHEDGE
jgi:preprotein translocase subunit YajC